MIPTDRTRERREWRLAGDATDHVIDRACLALALAGAAENHRRAEGL
ncbi:hypothetical protein ACFQL0_21905 [Haloplanus litoreus]